LFGAGVVGVQHATKRAVWIPNDDLHPFIRFAIAEKEQANQSKIARCCESVDSSTRAQDGAVFGCLV